VTDQDGSGVSGVGAIAKAAKAAICMLIRPRFSDSRYILKTEEFKLGVLNW